MRPDPSTSSFPGLLAVSRSLQVRSKLLPRCGDFEFEFQRVLAGAGIGHAESRARRRAVRNKNHGSFGGFDVVMNHVLLAIEISGAQLVGGLDRKSTRLNSSHLGISYA